MLIQYYKDDDLAYTTRRRYSSFNRTPFFSENNNSIRLGDGATTSIKTSASNLCNYVKIDDTRWFVVSHRYKNGGQIELFLQRDVIGEFGISNCFGKIERGITNNILQKRKELSLNQILKKRSNLVPLDNNYGGYYTDNHNKEVWGIMYLVKPTDGSLNATINIPAFTIKESSTNPILSNGKYYTDNWYGGSFSFIVALQQNYLGVSIYYYKCTVKISSSGSFLFEYEYDGYEYGENISRVYSTQCVYLNAPSNLINNVRDEVVSSYLQTVIDYLNAGKPLNGINLPSEKQVNSSSNNYISGMILKNNNTYYRVSRTSGIDTETCSKGFYATSSIFSLGTVKTFKGINFEINYNVSSTFVGSYPNINNNVDFFNYYSFYLKSSYNNLSFNQISPSDAGQLVLSFDKDMIDEPYVVYAVPLYDCVIKSNDGSETYTIDKEVAFNVFNNVIQYLSGENGYLVDAQIYPYCPYLTDVAVSYQGLPFFNILSTSYERNCAVDLEPFSNIKKEYICREYAIVSPDQSDKFSFNYYDYKNNISTLNIKIKTALKPFAIISSAVIQKDYGSLMGFDYESDLRGCQPSSNGFEVSLSTNQFQQYMRNNSNYEKIFNKNQEYLKKQQDVERKNELVSATVNTITAGTMGAIGAGSLGPTAGSKAVLGVLGGIASTGIVGHAMQEQISINDELRAYEYNLQKELFDLNIGTIKNLPNNISRISSFNEIILKDFWYIIETYECSEEEKYLVDIFLDRYSYSLGVYGYFVNYVSRGRFIKGNLITSSYTPILHNIASKELNGGIYYYGN